MSTFYCRWIESRGAWAAALFALVCLALPQHSHAQILQGQWVDDSQAAIEQHRKTDVTVIVLDQNDRAVQGAKVQLVQQRHDFLLGLTLPDDRMPPKDADDLPLYRCFNAIALDRYTSRAVPGDTASLGKRLAAWRSALDPIQTKYGRVISADPARNHDLLSLLESGDLRDAVLKRIDTATASEPSSNDYDLYADLMQQDMIERKLGQGMIHRMFNRAQASQPKASFGLRFRNAITLRRGRDLASAIQKLEVRQIPFDHITIEQTFTGSLQPNAFKRMLNEYIAPLPKPVTLASLEVGGATPVAAAINLETILRLSFAQQRIAGIIFAGLIDDELLEEHAGLIDSEGQPTASGDLIDQLFIKLWHSDESGQTDESGNVRTRVFTGWYTLTATLPDGTQVTSQAYIPKADRAKMIVLQATAAEAK